MMCERILLWSHARIASAVLARSSVRLSVTRRYCVKTTAHSTVQFAVSAKCETKKSKNIPDGWHLFPEILAQTDPPLPKSRVLTRTFIFSTGCPSYKSVNHRRQTFSCRRRSEQSVDTRQRTQEGAEQLGRAQRKILYVRLEHASL